MTIDTQTAHSAAGAKLNGEHAGWCSPFEHLARHPPVFYA